MARTIYVVNWTPEGVGGFEWRETREEADAVAKDQALFGTHPDRDDTVRVHEVELPENEEWTKYPQQITEWLDSEGWSDGGDPRAYELVETGNPVLIDMQEDAYYYRLDENDRDDPEVDPADLAVVKRYDAFGLTKLVKEAQLLMSLYDEVSEEWDQANRDENDAPTVKQCENYSDALESLAHSFAHVMSKLVAK